MPFKFSEKLTRADIGFFVTGKDLNELFTDALRALVETSANPETVQPKIVKKMSFSNTNIDELLFDALSELVFLKDAEYFVFSTIKAKVTKTNATYHAEIVGKGEEIDPKKHELRNDVKAITLHKFKVEKTPTGWKATVIVDV